ncbi:hypothetical protein [Jeotgalibacillus sp. R-1-5s-1]|uniref:hypothetical protein n=1 Tax=Jeotgalibacillus sp. R-1-5s-1 TaxID=2555897 RepID=UPI00106BA252|nr:hypothetical protein [Jeotgalibacillus sp. R-1-5s-1]TFE03351.1 hypothetical protein E2491_00755 [Jeotgalibacillus sp. R-1-5s-1]
MDNSDKKHHDQPDQLNSSKKNILDRHQDEQHTDPVPMEDLKSDKKSEKNKKKSQKAQSSDGLLDTE